MQLKVGNAFVTKVKINQTYLLFKRYQDFVRIVIKCGGKTTYLEREENLELLEQIMTI